MFSSRLIAAVCQRADEAPVLFCPSLEAVVGEV
ncbi:unnamed protein product [Spirodela intermedia]|nr:unnamed protein product [Spirodela intermedia]